MNASKGKRSAGSFKWVGLAAACLSAAGFYWYFHSYAASEVRVKLDQEQSTAAGKLLNPSTQSINRYHSVLRQLDRIRTQLSAENGTLSLAMGTEREGDQLYLERLDIRFLVPLLPYPHRREPDDFDLANLMLAEYARNGISLSYQDRNQLLGVFRAAPAFFNSDGEYLVEQDGGIAPNPGVRPTRFAVTNNCLKPGLWELSGSDSGGEMFHAWIDLPRKTYYEMVRLANRLKIPDWKLALALRYRENLGGVRLALDRLREEGKRMLVATPRLVEEKRIGSYSSQDSRRKTQQGYFQTVRDGKPFAARSFADLRAEDRFRMRKFVAPGIYSVSEIQEVAYQPGWREAEILEVEPRTGYPEGGSAFGEQGFIEIRLYNADRTGMIVIGNIPLALLIFQEDYRIPAFGVGVLAPSETVEQRYLRLRDGPPPHYAYQAARRESGWDLVNNHATGFEQIYLRPVQREEELLLRLTLVSYERIVDLVEFEIPLSGELAERVKSASKQYQPPLFRVYRDDNLL